MEEITGKQKTKSNFLPKEIKVDKTITQNPQDIAEEFNKFLTSVGPKLAKKILNTEKTFQEEAFKSLKRNKAAGFDYVSNLINIDAYDSLKKFLFDVFKVSVQQDSLIA